VVGHGHSLWPVLGVFEPCTPNKKKIIKKKL